MRVEIFRCISVLIMGLTCSHAMCPRLRSVAVLDPRASVPSASKSSRRRTASPAERSGLSQSSEILLYCKAMTKLETDVSRT